MCWESFTTLSWSVRSIVAYPAKKGAPLCRPALLRARNLPLRLFEIKNQDGSVGEAVTEIMAYEHEALNHTPTLRRNSVGDAHRNQHGPQRREGDGLLKTRCKPEWPPLGNPDGGLRHRPQARRIGTDPRVSGPLDPADLREDIHQVEKGRNAGCLSVSSRSDVTHRRVRF